jgi:large-conductance mechanosensitive channel
MKKNEIITLVIASIVISVSIFFLIKILNPAPKVESVRTEADQIQDIPESIDEATYERINSLSDYGEPALDNLGKSDIFSGY